MCYCDENPFRLYSLIQLNGLLDQAERHQETVRIRDIKEEIQYRNGLLDQDETLSIHDV